MVSVLIKRLHPGAERIDGSGGDEGRDVQVPTQDGLIVYQLKSFTDRLRLGGRKRQITSSLSNAAKHEPASWNLVVPLDHTLDEFRWFKATTDKYDFPCEWLGRTWLDSQMAQRPDIARYFLDDYKAEVLRLLRELRGEETTDGDALDVIHRLREVATRLDDSDPYYRYALIAGAGDVPLTAGTVLSVQVGPDRVDVVPKYRTAVKDRPITFSVAFDFGDDHANLRDEFQRTLKWGDPVELPPEVVKSLSLDAPAGLAADHAEGGHLKLGPAEESLPEPIPAYVTVVGPDGETSLRTHEFTMTRRRAGQSGAVLEGMDATGLLTLSLRLDVEQMRVTSNYKFSAKPVLPAVGAIAARWLALIRPPHTMRIIVGSQDGAKSEAEIHEPIVDEGLAEIYEAFELFQKRAGVSFPVPADLTEEEIATVHRVSLWLSPEKFRIRWTDQTLHLSEATSELLDKIGDRDAGQLLITQDVSLEFRDRTLSLGRLARTHESATVVNAAEVREALKRGDTDVTLQLEPGESDVAYEWLLKPEERIGGHLRNDGDTPA